MINKIRTLGKALLCLGIAGVLILTGCSQNKAAAHIDERAEEQTTGMAAVTDLNTDDTGGEGNATGIAGETARDAKIDFAALRAENQDIFAWIYIPDTEIDCPVLQSEEADDYYESHNAYGEASEEGAVYTELANLKNMCDFNTVLHGRTTKDGEEGLFSELYNFADPDFFENHETVYLYLERL